MPALLRCIRWRRAEGGDVNGFQKWSQILFAGISLHPETSLERYGEFWRSRGSVYDWKCESHGGFEGFWRAKQRPQSLGQGIKTASCD